MSNVHPIFQPLLDAIAPPISEENKALESFGEWLMATHRQSDTEAGKYYPILQHGHPYPDLYTTAECREFWQVQQIPPLPSLATTKTKELERIALEEAQFKYPIEESETSDRWHTALAKRRSFVEGVMYLAAQKLETIQQLITSH